MAKGKQTRVKKTHKKRNTRKHRRSNRKIKGGDCGCNKGLFKGGNINPASFDGSLQKHYYYPLNNEINNPNTPSIMQNARNIQPMTGGKKIRVSRKIKGGSYTLLGDAYSTNPLVTFGTMDDVGLNVITGIPKVNGSITDQPVIRGFTNNNPPLA
jgi:hypothetical protein